MSLTASGAPCTPTPRRRASHHGRYSHLCRRRLRRRWAGRELFETDAEGKPRRVAGCPPDYFAADGQLWGNPLYDWDYHRRTGYAWWILRIRHALSIYDILRIDHFRGFDTVLGHPGRR